MRKTENRPQDEMRRINMKMTIDTEDFLMTLNQKYRDGATDEDIGQWLVSIQPPDQDPRDHYNPDVVQLQNMRGYFEEATNNGRDEKVLIVKDWFRLNPHLPQPTAAMVHKFMWASKDDVERCKKRLRLFYNLKGTDDDIYGNRDPTSPAARQMQKVINYATLPIFTKESYRVNISALNICDPSALDPDRFNALEWVRQMNYVFDLRVKDDFCLGDVTIFDLKGFSLQHLLKFPLPLARKLILSTEGSLPTRIKQIHLINSPSYVDKIVNLFKPFMKEKMAHRIQVHTDCLEELYKFVPRELLPKDYGGNLETMSELSARWVKEFEDNREWFITEEKNIKRIYQEAKKNGKLFVDSGELFGMEGSFKKLDID